MFYSTDNDIITYPSNILKYTTEIHEVTHHSSNFCGALTRKCALFYFYFLLLKLKGTQGKLHTQFIRLDVAIPFIISMHITGSWKDTLNFRIHQYQCEQKISGWNDAFELFKYIDYILIGLIIDVRETL